MIPPYTYAAGRLAEEHMQDKARERPRARSVRRGRSTRQNLKHQAVTYLHNLGVLSSRKLLKETSLT
jgi:hypothetical protein